MLSLSAQIEFYLEYGVVGGGEGEECGAVMVLCLIVPAAPSRGGVGLSQRPLLEGVLLDLRQVKLRTRVAREGGAAVIFFPRSPKPHQAEDKWVKDHWMRE